MIRIPSLYSDLQNRLAELRRDASAVDASRGVVDRALASGNTFYGINTGFGALAQEWISETDLVELQRNLILSHAVGVGPLVSKEISRLMLQLKIHALSLGHSGVSREVFDRLMLFAEKDLIPTVPSKGSLGASGDLAPLAHLSLPLLGRGFFWDDAGEKKRPAAEVLQQNGLEPIDLHPKDGLALINGTQLMSAHGAYVMERVQRLLALADILATMSLEGLQGSRTPFDRRIHEIRPHPGQQRVAENVRMLLDHSEILESHRNCGKVQDPYCLRCVPQVHGASRDALTYVAEVVEREINSVTDNPLVFGEGGDPILSGGNFHGQPMALSLDFAAIALAEIANISERRTYLLLNGHDGLPPFLIKSSGLHSGYMIPQYTAAQLVSENKVLCHPASVDSIPSSRGQEDHVSMGSISATKLLQVLENVEYVLAIELMCAAQALDFRKPLRPGRGVEIAHDITRSRVAHREADEEFSEDIAACLDLLTSGDLLAAVSTEYPGIR